MSLVDGSNGEADMPDPDITNVLARVRTLSAQIASLEGELAELTAGQLNAIVINQNDPPILLARARRELAESEYRFRAVFDGALDCKFLCDDNRILIDVNPAGCRLLGHEKAALLEQPIECGLKMPSIPNLDGLWRTFLAEGTGEGELTLSRPDGAIIVEYTAVANIAPGTHLIVMRDVTEQRRTMDARDELNRELERRNRGLLALHGIGVKLGESLRLHDVYATIFREFTFHFLESPHLMVALFDKESQHFVCDFAVVDGEPFDPSVFPLMPLGEGPTSRAFLELTPQVVDIEYLESTLPAGRIVHIGDEAEPRSGVFVPLVVNNEAIGVLSVQHYEPNAFRDVDLTLLSVMANHAAAAIANALLYRQTQQEIADRMKRERELAAIARLSRDLRAVQSQASVVGIVLEQIETLFGASGAAVILDAQQQQRQVVHATGVYAYLCGSTRTTPWPVEQLCVIGNRSELDVWRGSDDSPVAELISVPLTAQNVNLGAIVLGLARAVERDDIDLLASLADIAASTLQRVWLYEQVQAQAQRLTRVMDTVVFGLVLLDRDRRIILANRPGLQAVEQLADAGLGDPLAAIGGVALDEILDSPAEGTRGREIFMDMEPPLTYEVFANPVEIDGASDGWVLVIRDVTADRAVQRQLVRQDRLAAMGQLAAGIAHDFNNILAVILLYVQMLQRSPNLNDSERKRLRVVREQAQHAGDLVRQVLDFSRMSVIERGPVHVVELIRAAMGLWERIMPESIRLSFIVDGDHLPTSDLDHPDHPSHPGHRDGEMGAANMAGTADGPTRAAEHEHEAAPLQSLSDEDDPYVIDGDASRLQQVLMNLAVNARDAMPVGGELRIELTRRVWRTEEDLPTCDLQPGLWLELSVTDTGEGISPKDLPNVFDPFYTTKDVGKGTGLGLAQVYGIIRQHGGHVTVDSKLGQGTRFNIYLPLASGSAHLASHTPDDYTVAAGSGRILLVEDNAAAREATRAILDMYGYEVTEAEDGTQALAYFQENPHRVDLILSDFVMPQMGGAELFREAVKLRPELGVLFMTGYPLGEEGRRLIELGTVDWLQKPFSIQELTDKLANLLPAPKS